MDHLAEAEEPSEAMDRVASLEIEIAPGPANARSSRESATIGDADAVRVRLEPTESEQSETEEQIDPLLLVRNEVSTNARQPAFGRVVGGIVRLMVALVLHVLVLATEIIVMVFYVDTGTFYYNLLLIVPLALSAMLCTSAAWHSRAPLLEARLGFACLPLKERPLLVRFFLVLILGVGQGVIILLELEDYLLRQRRNRRRANTEAVQSGQTSLYHCKAVSGSLEALMASCIVLYGYWGLRFPADTPILRVTKWTFGGNVKHILATLFSIPFLSASLGLLQLDFAISPRIQRRIQASLGYEIVHWLFRFSEIVSRICLLVGTVVLTRKRSRFYFVPALLDCLTSICLVDIYGGCEVTALVLLLCAAPCCFTDVFRFIDSPHKRRAARKLSRALCARNLAETLLFPVFVFVANEHAMEDLLIFFEMHRFTCIAAVTSIPLYWILFWYLAQDTIHQDRILDIFSACECADVQAVLSLTTKAIDGIDLNVFDVDGKTPLMCAVLHKSHRKIGAHIVKTPERRDGAVEAEICRLLVEEGARVDLQLFEDRRCVWTFLWPPMRRRWTALHMAAARGTVDVVSALVEGEHNFGSTANFDGQYIDRFGETPLHVAAQRGHVEAAECLLDGWPEWLTVRNQKGRTPYEVARTNEMRKFLELAATGSGSNACRNNQARGSRTSNGRKASLRSDGIGTVDDIRRDSRMQSTGQQWQWVRMPILFTFSDERGPCRAPGLSSYVASCGSGTLGRVFLESEAKRGANSLETIDEETSYQCESNIKVEAQKPLARSSQTHPSTPHPGTRESITIAGIGGSSIGIQAHAESGSFRLSWSKSPLSAGLEPIDSQGKPVKTWRDMIALGQREGRPLGAAAFQVITKESLLGQGAYGVVWRAQDRRTGTQYAVKNIKMRGTGPSPAERECEMSDHIRLQPHPCIVHLYAVHCFPELSFYMIVMEYCSSGDLQGNIRHLRKQAAEHGRDYTPPPLATRWAAQIFVGLEHLHLSMHSLLRDLKPGNVVISSQSIAKLTDFGLGCMVTEAAGAWTFGMPPGSPGYIAPECLLQQRYDSSADLYSYGVLLWVLYSGGVKYKHDPQPPVAKPDPKNRRDFLVHANDWKFLSQCLLDPDGSGAIQLDVLAFNLVARLINRRPDKRPSHAEIRQHPLMRDVNLPEAGSSPDTVQAWVSGCMKQT